MKANKILYVWSGFLRPGLLLLLASFISICEFHSKASLKSSLPRADLFKRILIRFRLAFSSARLNNM